MQKIPKVTSRNNPNYQDPKIIPEYLQKVRAANFALHVLLAEMPKSDRRALKASGFFKYPHRLHLSKNTSELLKALDRLELMIKTKTISLEEFNVST